MSDTKTVFWRSPALGGVELMEARFTEHSFPRHFHNTFVIQVVERGVDTFVCSGNTYVATEGHIVLINPGEVHTGASNEATPLAYRSFYPSARIMRHVVQTAGIAKAPWFSQTVVDDCECAEALIEVHQSLAAGLENEKELLSVLAILVDRYGMSVNERRASREGWAVERAKLFIKEHFAEPLSLEKIAHECGYSTYHFARMFAKAVGIPPYEYMMAIRIEEAKRLIRSGQNLVDVAAEVGFADQAHFTRQFKQLVGAPPGDFSRTARSIKRDRAASQ
jgi:AraC-like DNA-binding protein